MTSTGGRDLTALFAEAAATHGLSGLDFSAPDDKHATVDGVGFHYVDWRGGGPPVLFLHGGYQTCRTWDMVCAQARGRYRCYAMDERNHGDSETHHSNDMSPAAQSADIRGVVEAIGLDRYVLVGMSMGGLNGIAYAARYPEGLAAMVLVDVGPTVRKAGGQAITDFSKPRPFPSFEAAVEEAVRFNPLRPKAHLEYSLVHSLRREADGSWAWKHRFPEDRIMAREVEQGDTVDRPELWEDVARIACPTLVMRGGESRVFFDEDAEKLEKALAKGSRVTIPGAGHTVQGDRPKEFVAALDAFLADAL